MKILCRSIIIFIVLFIILKILGKKQINHLTFYDYVIGIAIGSIAADSIISIDVPIYDGIIALAIFGVIGYIFSYLSLKSHKTEEFIDGKSLILFENDQFIYPNLEKSKLTIAKVLEFCRLKGCFDINELNCAILESSGDISILLKPSYQNVTNNDLKETVKKRSIKQRINYNIIVDGSLDEDELKRAKKTKKWLKEYLKTNNKKKKSIEDIALFCMDVNDKVTVFYKK